MVRHGVLVSEGAAENYAGPSGATMKGIRAVRPLAQRRGRPAAVPTLRPLPEVLAALVASLTPVAPRSVPLAEAEGRILAEPLRAPGPVPDRAIALREGVAVRAAETQGASAFSPVLLAAQPQAVRPGEALPEGADAVLPAESLLQLPGGAAEIQQAASPGEGARRSGEDLAPGAVLAEAGRMLDPLALAAAEAAGIETCAVRMPEVALIGAEGAASRLLAARIGRSGAALVGDPERAVLLVALGDPADAAIAPIARDLFAADPASASALAIRPGEGIFVGRSATSIVAILPDRPAEALATSLLVLEPLLRRLSAASEPRSAPVRLSEKIASALGFTELALLAPGPDGYRPLGSGDLSLGALAQATEWLAVPPGSEGHAAGAGVEVFSL